MHARSPGPTPSSWYCVGFSEAFLPGVAYARQLAGEAIVVFRDADGAPATLDAYCPHLGAHLGVGGTVTQGAVRCPFHGFQFDREGQCVATAYDGKIPPNARLRAWPTVEVNGLVLVWFGAAGEAPSFAVPAVDTAGFTAWRHHTFSLNAHPQEIAENSVDTGHLVVVHGYRNLTDLAPLALDGPHLRARYGFERPRQSFGQSSIRSEIDIHQWGLGYALVEVHVVSVGLRTRQLVLATPTAEDTLELRVGMAVHHIDNPRALHWALTGFPATRWLTERVADRAIGEYVADVSQDLDIWQTKRWIERPALAQGDGPIGKYRRWAKQFYPQP